MPIWLSIALAVSAAVGAYILAPVINQDLEFQKNRSAHVLQTVQGVNSDFVALTSLVRKFNDSLFYKKADLSEKRGNLLDKIAEMQWKTVDVGVIINRAGNDNQCTEDLRRSFTLFKSSVIEANKPEDQEDVIEAYTDAARIGKECMTVFYDAANLS